MKPRSSVDRAAVRANAPTLFVEGKDESHFDPELLGAILPGIQVLALDNSHVIRGASAALSRHFPRQYYLVDRDHHTDDDVANAWSKFASNESNLLVWRNRELENYFLTPSWLVRSAHLRPDFDEAKLTRRLEKIASERLYFEVARSLVIECREAAKAEWITTPSGSGLFPDAESALRQILDLPHWSALANRLDAAHSEAALRHQFAEIQNRYSGGIVPLKLGTGQWLSQMPGKEILNQLLNECFRRPTRPDGTPLESKRAARVILLDLLNQDKAYRPEDFRQLKDLLAKRVSAQ